jgi:hypothetical protein
VRATDAGVLPELVEALPFGWSPSRRAVVDHMYSMIVAGGGGAGQRRKRHLLFRGTEILQRSADVGSIVDTLEKELCLLVGERSPNRVFLHAGVVAWKGRAILLPGKSFSGKTTLVAEFIRSGAKYYSDEFAVLDDRGRVHPYARPLGVRVANEFKGRPVPVEAIGGHSGSTPLRVGMAVFAQYSEGGSWQPRRLTAGETVLRLLENSLGVRADPERVVNVVTGVARETLSLSSERGEANDCVSAVLDAVDWAASS